MMGVKYAGYGGGMGVKIGRKESSDFGGLLLSRKKSQEFLEE